MKEVADITTTLDTQNVEEAEKFRLNGEAGTADGEVRLNAEESAADGKDSAADGENAPEIQSPEEKDRTPEEAGAEETDEKLLFRDTTSELVEAAVFSLNRQGLASVQYRKEEDTYAVYASPEEFEKARELLIDILKDEAENIRERARTLEAKRTLREMETTELAPGFRPQKTSQEKYEDANSTAIAFLVVGALGIVFVVLEYFGIFFSLGLSENVRYIFYPTMLVMFAAFLIVGFVNMNQAAKWKEQVFDEQHLIKDVHEYAERELLQEILKMITERVVNESGMDESAESMAAAGERGPEDALAQLDRMFEEGILADNMTPAGKTEPDEGVVPGEDAIQDADAVPGEGVMPDEDAASDENAVPEESVTSDEGAVPDKDAVPGKDEIRDEDLPPENGETAGTPETADYEEMENVFNDYYAMEQEIQLHLIKEFPDLPANLLLEATEYVIKLVEESLEKPDTENAEDI